MQRSFLDATATLYRVAHCRPEIEHVVSDEKQLLEKPLGPVTVVVCDVASMEAFQEARREFTPQSTTAVKP